MFMNLAPGLMPIKTARFKLSDWLNQAKNSTNLCFHKAKHKKMLKFLLKGSDLGPNKVKLFLL